jgi:hypothetical protein
MINLLNFHRRAEQKWAETVKLVKQVAGQAVVAAKRTLQSAVNRDGLLVPVPVRIAVDRRRLDRSRD